MTKTTYRAGLPALPWRMTDRPLDSRGYPVPWFAAMVDGQYDLRIAEPAKHTQALRERLCWLCGKRMIKTLTFVAGPLVAITRTHAEPSCHEECATYAAQACPFLTQQQVRRRVAGLPEIADAPGILLDHRPSVVCLWQTRSASLFSDGAGGTLLKVGTPIKVRWYSQARPASRDEVVEALNRSYELLCEQAALDGEDALAELAARRLQAEEYLPE